MIPIFVALLIFVLVYVISKLLLSKVEPVSGIADTLGLILGVLAALLYLGVLK